MRHTVDAGTLSQEPLFIEEKNIKTLNKQLGQERIESFLLRYFHLLRGGILWSKIYFCTILGLKQQLDIDILWMYYDFFYLSVFTDEGELS